MFRYSHARGLGKRWREREKEGWRERKKILPTSLCRTREARIYKSR